MWHMRDCCNFMLQHAIVMKYFIRFTFRDTNIALSLVGYVIDFCTVKQTDCLCGNIVILHYWL